MSGRLCALLVLVLALTVRAGDEAEYVDLHATQPPAERAVMPRLEFLALVLLSMHFMSASMDSTRSVGKTVKWRLISTLFPSYQMWRGAFGERYSQVVCADWGLKPLGDYTTVTEYELQKCFKEMTESLEDSSKFDIFRRRTTGFQVVTKMFAAVCMLLLASVYAFNPHAHVVDSSTSFHPSRAECWYSAQYDVSSKPDCTIQPQVLTWEECKDACVANANCRLHGLIAYNVAKGECMVDFTAFDCDPGLEFLLKERSPCHARHRTSCGDLFSSADSPLGAFDHGDSRATVCPLNGFGQVCTVRCAPGYSTDARWGSTAMCGYASDGNLMWTPNTIRHSTWENPLQDLCSPDAVHKRGLLLHLDPRTYRVGVASTTQERSIAPEWTSGNVTFTALWDVNHLESVGPALDTLSHGNTPSLSFATQSSGATHLMGVLPYDRLRQHRSLAVFAAIDPETAADYLSFTTLFNLERVMFADENAFGLDFINAHSSIPPADNRQWVVVALIANPKDENTMEIALRINGVPVYANGYREVAFDCAKLLNSPQGSSCSATDFIPTSAPHQVHGPCSPSELFCARSVFAHAHQGTPLRTALGAGVVGDPPSLRPFNGWIGDVAVYETPLRVQRDDEENLRRIEAIEWELASKYHLRRDFAPAQPPAPAVEPGEKVGTVRVSFPPQATALKDARVTLQVASDAQFASLHEYDVGFNKTVVFVVDVQSQQERYYRLTAQAKVGGVKLVGTPTLFTLK